MDEQWINNLRKRFKDRKVTAPDGLWESIETAMADADTNARKPESAKGKARVVPLWMKRSAAAVACIVVLAGATMLWMKSSGDANMTQTTPEKSLTARVADKNKTVNAAEEPIVTSENSVAQDLKSRVRRALRLINGDAEASATIAEAAQSEENKPLTSYNNAPDSTAHTVASAPSKDVKRHTTVPVKDENAFLAATMKDSHSSGKGVSVSLYGSNLMAMGGSTGNGFNAYSSADYYNMALPGSSLLVSSPLIGDRLAAADPSRSLKVKHHQPIRAGLSVGFVLNNRLTLTTGANYSYLSSDITAGDGYNDIRTDQRLHYVGVPLALTCEVWGNRRLSVYATAGGGVDFCVGGSSHSEYMSNGTVIKTTDEDTRDPRPQWSVNAAAGVQYNFTPVVGVYVEPGLGYYFDNHSDVTTIYKDKPVNFNLNLGLRLTLNRN